MRLESVLFHSSYAARYERMANVLRLSAAENSPATPLNITRIYDADEDVKACARQNCRVGYIDNARKAKHHCRIINEARDGEVLGMLDADTMVLGDLSEAEEMEFDIAYTVRPHIAKAKSHWKLNTGVYFVRVNYLTSWFCQEWFAVVKRMLADDELHNTWKRDKGYGGTHQAALGWLLEETEWPTLTLLPLPCEKWNAVPSCIEQSPSPKVVHIMSSTRQCCFGDRKPTGDNLKQLVEKWQEYDAKASVPFMPINPLAEGNYNYASAKLDADAYRRAIG